MVHRRLLLNTCCTKNSFSLNTYCRLHETTSTVQQESKPVYYIYAAVAIRCHWFLNDDIHDNRSTYIPYCTAVMTVEATCPENLVNLGCVALEICLQTDTQTQRQTTRNIVIRYTAHLHGWCLISAANTIHYQNQLYQNITRNKR